MLQRKGRRVKAGLEEDALERSVSQSVFIHLSGCLSAHSQYIVFVRASIRLCVHPARICTSVCFIVQANIQNFFKQTR